MSTLVIVKIRVFKVLECDLENIFIPNIKVKKRIKHKNTLYNHLSAYVLEFGLILRSSAQTIENPRPKNLVIRSRVQYRKYAVEIC